MAVLQTIRNKPRLLIGVIAVALLAFIIPWSEVMTFMNRQKFRAFEVGGETVSTEQYFARVSEFENFQKLISGQTSLDENTVSQIREFVYEQMVKEIILTEQSEKIGLGVSEAEMHDLMFGPNPSPVLRQIPFFVNQQTGQYDPQALMQFLSEINTDPKSVPAEVRPQLDELKALWSTIENMVKYNCLESKFNALLANSIIVNDIEIKNAEEASKSASDIAYVINRYSSMPDSAVTVTDKEIEKLYSERKNNFKVVDNLRKVSYFTKEITPSEADYAIAEKEITTAREKLAEASNPALVVADYSEVPYQDAYFSAASLSPEELNFAQQASVGEMYGPTRNNNEYRLYKLIDKTSAPDSVRLSMIVLPEGTDKLAANAKADSIIDVIKGGKDFALVATEIAPQSNGGQVGWVTEPQLLSAGKEFVQASFNTPVGGITKLNLQGQIQIVKVDEKTSPVTKYKLALIQIPVTVSDQTLAAIDNELNQFVAENSNAKTFVSAATEKGYNIIPESIISSSMPGIGQISGSRQVINWAFNESAGSIKKFDLADYKIIAMVDDKIDKGVMPLKDVKDILKAELIKDKKAEKMITDMKAKNITSLSGYAQDLGTRVDTVKYVTFDTPNIMGIGRESVLNVFAELGQLNKVNEPVKGQNGVIVADVVSRVDQSQGFSADNTKQSAMSQNYYRMMSQSMAALKSKVKIDDNRVKFF